MLLEYITVVFLRSHSTSGILIEETPCYNHDSGAYYHVFYSQDLLFLDTWARWCWASKRRVFWTHQNLKTEFLGSISILMGPIKKFISSWNQILLENHQTVLLLFFYKSPMLYFKVQLHLRFFNTFASCNLDFTVFYWDNMELCNRDRTSSMILHWYFSMRVITWAPSWTHKSNI